MMFQFHRDKPLDTVISSHCRYMQQNSLITMYLEEEDIPAIFEPTLPNQRRFEEIINNQPRFANLAATQGRPFFSDSNKCD